jgi:hypothetical protein
MHFLIAFQCIALQPLLATVTTHATCITVDDADLTQWSYTGPWNAITPTDPCSACATQPDPTQAFNHTWHDSSLPVTARLVFTGIAIEVYTICPPYNASGYYGTNFTFLLDAADDGTFRGPQPACANFVYNYLVYARTNLTPGEHSFVISNSPFPGLNYSTSDLVLDYAIYDDGNSTASTGGTALAGGKSLSVVAVAAPVAVMGVLLLVAIAMAGWLYRKQRNKGNISYTGRFSGSLNDSWLRDNGCSDTRSISILSITP